MQLFPVHDPVLIFAIVMLAVLIAPLAAEKMRLPGTIGLILIGIILGPHVTTILERDKTIELLGTIGLLYIMFQAGLEINLEEIKKNKHHSIIFGLLTFAVPFAMGTLSAYYILNFNLAASILLASLFSSHTLLTFPMVSRLGLSKKKPVAATVGGTIITDTLAIIILAVILGISKGQLNALFWVKLVGYSAVYVSVVILLLPKLTSWFFRTYFSDSGVEDYVFVITALFISAFFAHLIGLEPIIGAFLAGLTLNPLIPENGILMNRIQFVGNSLFIPFFLISVGMLVDPLVLITNSDAITISVVMIVIAFLSKDIAARIFAASVGFSSAERGLIFGMSVNQAAATLAVVLVGFRVGIFENDVLTGTIMMIIATCFFGSIITQKYARRIAREMQESPQLSGAAYPDRILIPLSNAEKVTDLMDFAVLLHPSISREPLYPMHIALESSNVDAEIIEGETILTKAGVRANAAQKSVIPLNTIDHNISSAIIKTVSEQRISRIILGWKEKDSLTRSFFSTIAEQLARNCNKAIYVTRLVNPVNLVKRIIVIVPPFLYKQQGFADTVTSLNKLGSAISAGWLITAEEETCSNIAGFFSGQKSDIHYNFVTSWKEVTATLKNVITSSDMIIQLVPRRDSIAWRLDFEQLPNRLCKAFPANNMIALYPYNAVYDGEDTSAPEDETTCETDGLCSMVPVENIFFNLTENNAQEAIKHIVYEKIKTNTDDVYRIITGVLNDYPLELTADIALIHSRTDLLDQYKIFFAINKSGFTIRNIESDNTHRILIILLSPASESTQSHLNVLSRIARLVMIEPYVDALLTAEDSDGFMKQLQQTL